MYYGIITNSQRIVADAAVIRPDLLDVSFLSRMPFDWFQPTEPTDNWHDYLNKEIFYQEIQTLMGTLKNESFNLKELVLISLIFLSFMNMKHNTWK